MKIQLSEQDAILCLNISAQAIALSENIDKLKHTSIFKQSIKRDANNLGKELFEIGKVASDLFDVDDTAMMALLENTTNLVANAMQLRPEQWQLMPYMLKWINEPKSLRFAQVKALCIADDAERETKTKF